MFASLAIGVALLKGGAQSSASEDTTPYSDLSLISGVEKIDGDKPFLVGVSFSMDDAWHIYWKNPGDSGMPPAFEWSLPEGFKITKSYWPAPKRFKDGEIWNYGYEGVATVLFEVTPASGFTGGKAEIGVAVDYLICKDQCLPGFDELKMTVGQAEPHSFKEAMSAVPAKIKGSVRVSPTEDGWTLSFTTGAPFYGGYFFAEDASLVNHEAPQPWKHVWTNVGGESEPAQYHYSIELKRSPYLVGKPKKVSGVLMLKRGEKKTHYEISVDLRSKD